MEQLVVIDNNKIYIYNADNHPIFNEDVITEDIVESLGHNYNDVVIAWGEDFTIKKSKYEQREVQHYIQIFC